MFNAVKEKSTRHTAIGAALGVGWYVSATALLSGSVATVAPAAGAIALTALVPIALRKWARPTSPHLKDTLLAQRMAVCNRHTMINVVDRNAKLVEVNDLLVETTGYAREDLIGKPIDMLYDDTGRALVRRIRRMLQRGESWAGQTPLRKADGSSIFTHTTTAPLYDDDGEWVGSISARTDVTQINKLMALQSSAEILNELRDEIWILDADELAFSYMNHASLDRLDWRQDGFRGRSLSDVADAEAVRVIGNACQLLKKTHQMNSRFDVDLMGTPFSVGIKFLPAAAQPARFLITLTDLTEARAQEQTKSDFISMVSHELRSPLTSIKGSMGLLLSNAAGELPDKAAELLQIAHRNADRLVLIINDILDLEKISAGRMDFVMEDVDLGALIRETDQANEMMRQRLGLTVKIEGTENPIPLSTDPNRIIQVLTNLLSNACKFSRPGGIITISVRDDAEKVRISVRDQGMGIPQKDQHKIFQRFADLENSERAAKGGTGLGLNICKAIVESLGGKIGFETEEGVGTSFNFVLPKDSGSRLIISQKDDVREAS